MGQNPKLEEAIAGIAARLEAFAGELRAAAELPPPDPVAAERRRCERIIARHEHARAIDLLHMIRSGMEP